MARVYVEACLLNELSTLDTILELADDGDRVGNHIEQMKATVEGVAAAHLEAIEAHMRAVADQLGTSPVRIVLTDLERQAARIIPRQTALVTANGYNGYSQHLGLVSEEDAARYPYTRQQIANTSELQLLIDGKYSVLDIKKALDAQYQRPSDLQAIMNYLEILKLAGLVEF